MNILNYAGVAVLLAAPGFVSGAEGVSDKMLRLEADANGGSAEAMVELAAAYHGGSGGAVDVELAVMWLRRAASAGFKEAHVWLGEMHETGTGVPRDLVAARREYEIAAQAGVQSANFRLGLMHFEGWSVPREPETALAFFKIAAEADYVPAQRILADILMFGYRVPKNPAAALMWAERAAAVGDPAAAERIGTAYFGGLGVKRDIKSAREWYLVSSEDEYIEAMKNMARTYFTAERTRENFEKTVHWLELAVEAGSQHANFILAGIYMSRSPREPHFGPMARDHLRLAAEGGFDEAIEVESLEKSGMTLFEAMRYVWTTPEADRYARSWNSKHEDPRNSPPKIIGPLRPKYPEGLQLIETEGRVVLRFVVGKDGSVGDIEVVSSTHPGFEENAIIALRDCQFSPGVKNGRSVATNMQLPIRFQFRN